MERSKVSLTQHYKNNYLLDVCAQGVHILDGDNCGNGEGPTSNVTSLHHHNSPSLRFAEQGPLGPCK